jgi:hypothetical protein
MGRKALGYFRDGALVGEPAAIVVFMFTSLRMEEADSSREDRAMPGSSSPQNGGSEWQATFTILREVLYTVK